MQHTQGCTHSIVAVQYVAPEMMWKTLLKNIREEGKLLFFTNSYSIPQDILKRKKNLISSS